MLLFPYVAHVFVQHCVIPEQINVTRNVTILFDTKIQALPEYFLQIMLSPS